jgi:hypothetical protein
MLKLQVNLRVKENLRAKCPRHPKFDPSADERLHTEPGCSVCADIRALQLARVSLEEAVRAFERRAYQWQVRNLPNRSGGD